MKIGKSALNKSIRLGAIWGLGIIAQIVLAQNSILPNKSDNMLIDDTGPSHDSFNCKAGKCTVVTLRKYGFFKEMGLKEGDVIKEWNGERFFIDQDMTIEIPPVMSPQNISMTVVRDGVEKKLQLAFGSSVDRAGVKEKKPKLILKHLEKNSIYAKIGLKEGDVIEKWNGKEMTRPDDWSAIDESLRLSKEFTIVIERNRKQMVLKFKK